MKKFKFLISSLLLLIFFSTVCSPVFASETPEIIVFVDGTQLEFDVKPIIEDGRTLVPMRFIFEALGAEVEWNGETNTAIASKGDIEIKITIGENKLIRNGEEIELDVPARLESGRTLVPVRAISEGLDATVEWDGELYTVTITNAAETQYPLNELTPDDVHILKSLIPDFRYQFEQYLIPSSFVGFPIPESTADAIAKKDVALLEEFYMYWDSYMYNNILSVQINSESVYEFPESEMTVEEEMLLIEGYNTILKTHGLDAKSTFEVSYESTPANRKIILLTFKSVDSNNPLIIHCKYIALVPADEEIRCFTAEYSSLTAEALGKEAYMFCEILADGRGSYFDITTDKKAFLAAVDRVFKERLELSVSTQIEEE